MILLCLQVTLLGQFEIFAQGFNGVTTPDGINLLAAGNLGLIYRSQNSGQTWTNATFGTSNINGVASYGNDVWMAVSGGKVYKTQKTNSAIVTYSPATVNLNSIYFVNSSLGYTCGDNGVIYKSADGGENWSLKNSGIPNVKLNSICFADSDNGIVAGNNGIIYVTNDGATSWTAQESGTTRNLLKVKYFGSKIYAVGEYGTLLSSEIVSERQAPWTSINTRIKTDLRGITGTSSSDVHVCGGGGFIRNNKNGSNNFYNFEINPMMGNLIDIYYFDSNNGWAVNNLNPVIIYTTNGGASWSMPSGASLSLSWVSKLSAGGGIGNNLCEHPNNRDAMFVVYGSTIYRSGNRGENWTNIASVPGGGSAHSFYVSPLDTNIFMIAIEDSPRDSVKRSTNYGATWTNIIGIDFSNYGQPLEMDQNNPSVYYYAPDGGGFYKSTDNGASFLEISGNYPFRSPCDIVVMWDSSNVIYVGDGNTNGSGGAADIFKSSNGGVNWTKILTVASNEVPSMCNTVFDKSIAYATNWGGGQLYKTTNYGANFYLLSTQTTSGWGSDICHEDPSLVLKGTYGSPTWLSTNSGASFPTSLSVSLSGAGAGIIVPERGYQIAMQTSGLYKLSIAYSYTPVPSNIDVQSSSVGATGYNLYSGTTIIPTGTVKNNNGGATATFNVTRKITPGGYSSTKTLTNLAPLGSANVNFDSWTFIPGTVYSVRDSVYIPEDANTSNDVVTGSITPYIGEYVAFSHQTFTGSFPPSGWATGGGGTQYWMINNSYGNPLPTSEYNFWNASSGTNQTLTTSTFTASVVGAKVSIDIAYAPYTSGVDSLLIQVSTNGGTTYSTLMRLYGKDGYTGDSSLATMPTLGSEYFPTSSSDFQTKSYNLPTGVNRLRFRARSGFGNNLFLDNVKILNPSLYTLVNLTLAPEGFYNGSGMNMRDTVNVYLRNVSSPFAIVDSAKSVIDSVTLTAPGVFKNAPNGTYYYQVMHRNSLETWSDAGGESFTKGTTSSFDFTSLQSQSYGSNSVLVGTKWCLFGGDVNRDGTIDLADLGIIDNDIYFFESGYIVTDLNGDGAVDIADAAIADNNSFNFVTKVTPQTSPLDVQSSKADSKKLLDERSIKNIQNKNWNLGKLTNKKK